MNAIVLQSGGPTAVINASLAGVIAVWQWSPQDRMAMFHAGQYLSMNLGQLERGEQAPGQLWGARFGWKGLVSGDWINLSNLPVDFPKQIINQPAAALASGRDRLEDKDLPGLVDQLKRREIGVVFVIGGNGSMAAAHRLHLAAGGTVRVIGIPKTIDNDIAGTDVCPGYPSAACWIATTTRDVGLDLHAMRGFDDVAILEVMGRNAGWLAAASALARWKAGTPPHLILLPEVPFDEEAFLAAVKRQNDREGCCLIVTSEGVRDQSGTFLAKKGRVMDKDQTGQALLALAGGPTPYLARIVQDRLGLRCRQIRPDTVQRSSSLAAVLSDRDRGWICGALAVGIAIHRDTSDVMTGYSLKGDQVSRWNAIPLSDIAQHERPLPPEFIDAANFDVTPAFIDYAKPLIGDWNPEAVIL